MAGNLEPVIGLEIHVQPNTKTKMFCPCANVFGDVRPNSAICPICLGYPGTLPVPNQQAIELTLLMGAALRTELATESKFDRKSYFYPDLPKGYQISQYDKPLCGKGELTITVNDTLRRIGITRIHLEEDAAKSTHDPDTKTALIDYNRAGTPLIEIVTEPDIRSPEEAKVFLQELQQTVRALGVSTADMEKGQMRCDANISMRKAGSSDLHPKTEIKNINSFRFVEKALQYEIERQKEVWQKGIIPPHATRGWNSKTGKTIQQRTKEEAADYRYFPEPDIP
ncbi:MAG: Asp-tRNA(Asn)/Glu-tRNA(Gln) amidotransferase subunit GatB, partial [Acidobacteriota bacterium]